MEKSDSIIIIPTYNEKENIENIIRAVFGLEKFFHISSIEDNSPDGTATIVRKLQTEFPDRLFMIERKGKLGLGTAYIAGFKWALEHGYDYIFEMDADFSHNPQDLPRLYRACSEEGARYRTKQNPVIDGEVRSKQKMHRAGVYLKRELPSLGVRQPHRRGYLCSPAAAPPLLSFCGG